MGSSDESRGLRRSGAGLGPTLRWLAAIGATLAIALLVLSGIASAANPASPHLRVTRDVSGTVTLVNQAGSAFCMDTDVTGTQFCSAPYQRTGSAPLAVGEHVTGTAAWLSTGPSDAIEVFIVADSPAP